MPLEQKKLILETFFTTQNIRIGVFFVFNQPIILKKTINLATVKLLKQHKRNLLTH